MKLQVNTNFGPVHFEAGDHNEVGDPDEVDELDPLLWFDYGFNFEFGGDRFDVSCMTESVTLERATGEVAEVLIQNDLSHIIYLPPGFPMTVGSEYTHIFGEPLLWVPPLGDEPIVLTKKIMARVIKELQK